MKFYIYIVLTLLSISVSQVQATDKPSIEEIATSKDYRNVVAGVLGGVLAGAGASTGSVREPATRLGASIIGYLFGSKVTDVMSKNNNDNTTLIAFWTSFLTITFANHIWQEIRNLA